MIRRNEEGVIYGITYIDYKNKVVFNGSDLGKEYSAKDLIERLAQRIIKEQDAPIIQRSASINSVLPQQKEDWNVAGEKEKSDALETTIALLMGPAKNDNCIPYQLKGKKKKKKVIRAMNLTPKIECYRDILQQVGSRISLSSTDEVPVYLFSYYFIPGISCSKGNKN